MGSVAPEAAVDPLPWRDYKKDKASARWLLAQDRQTKTLHPESLACQSVHHRLWDVAVGALPVAPASFLVSACVVFCGT